MAKRTTDYFFEKSNKEKQIKLNIEPISTSLCLVSSTESSSSLTVFENKNHDSVTPVSLTESLSSILDVTANKSQLCNKNTEWYKG